jgi:hypothetical protein
MLKEHLKQNENRTKPGAIFVIFANFRQNGVFLQYQLYDNLFLHKKTVIGEKRR